MSMLEIEIGRHDWASLRQSAGLKADLPAAIRGLVASASKTAATELYWELELACFVERCIDEAGEAVVSCLLAALADGVDSEHARGWIIEVIFQVVGGEPSPDEIAMGNADVVERCRSHAREGLWLLYGLLPSAGSRNVRQSLLWTLELVDPEPGRVRVVAERFG